MQDFDIKDPALAHQGAQRIERAWQELPVLGVPMHISATGDKHVIDAPHLAVAKDGCVLANSGYFDVEINIPALEALAVARRRPRPSVDEYTLADGRRLRLLAEGRLVNLASAEGHPSAVMDMGFADQLLCAVHLAAQPTRLAPQVHDVPSEIDHKVARLKLAAMGVQIDTLSEEQQRHLSSSQEGTS